MASPILPPDLTRPLPIDENHKLLDYDLKSWFDTITPSAEGEPGATAAALPTDVALLKKLRQRSSRDKYLYKELENQIGELLREPGDKGYSAVLPYIIDEILQLNNLSPAITSAWESKLGGLGLGSCPEKDLLLQDIALASTPPEQLFKRLMGFDSMGFRKEALRKLMPAMTAAAKPLSAGTKAQLRQGFFDRDPKFALRYRRFFKQTLGVKNSDFTRTPRKPRLNCKARERLATKAAQQGQPLSAVKPLLLKAERCYRRYGSRSRLRYWQRVKRPLYKAYGFPGTFFPDRKRAGIYWGRDNFKTAIKLVSTLVADARAGNHGTEESEALFLLARIQENNSNTAAAIQGFQDYAQKFKDGPHINDVLKKLTVLQFQSGDYENSLRSSTALSRYHLEKPTDQRDTGYLSFALYWTGRLHYKLGQKDQAIDFWKRLIQDYYTTFYGALGHHTLELVTGQTLAMTPTANPPFKGFDLTKGFSKKAKARVAAIEALLQIGDKRDASCEFEELLAYQGKKDSGAKATPQGKKPSVSAIKVDERFQLVKSMYLYALGDWLEAIKTYSALPRTFRKALPRGMERMLFPRKYAQLVDKNARKLNLDSSLILAIIRQESVFNNRARSPVGARGLMQLMPATAYMEARRITTNRSLRKKSRRWIKGNLYKADTNIAIGVHHVFSLLRRYENPILVLTSYNASPSATKRWLKNIPTEDQLAFIEQIPYEETRNYVKLVMRNYFYYKRWYPDSDAPDGKHLTMLVENILDKSRSAN